MTENWKPVTGFEGLYKVSSGGLIVNERNGRYVRGTVYSNGYRMVCLSNNGKVTRRHLHAIVAKEFIGERPNGFHVDHIDGNKANNNAANLRYLTPTDNRMATVHRGAHAVGSNNGQSKLNEAQVAMLIEAKQKGGRFWGAKQFARELGVELSTIVRATSGKTWQCAAAIRSMK